MGTIIIIIVIIIVIYILLHLAPYMVMIIAIPPTNRHKTHQKTMHAITCNNQKL